MSSSGDAPNFFNGLLPQSRLAVSMATAILRQPGLEGWMMVYIPPDERAPCEIMTSTHGWNLSFDPGGFNPRKKARS